MLQSRKSGSHRSVAFEVRRAGARSGGLLAHGMRVGDPHALPLTIGVPRNIHKRDPDPLRDPRGTAVKRQVPVPRAATEIGHARLRLRRAFARIVDPIPVWIAEAYQGPDRRGHALQLTAAQRVNHEADSAVVDAARFRRRAHRARSLRQAARFLTAQRVDHNASAKAVFQTAGLIFGARRIRVQGGPASQIAVDDV